MSNENVIAKLAARGHLYGMRAALLALLLMTTPALALQDVDGTLIELPTAQRGIVKVYMGRGLKDPESLQVRRVRSSYTGTTLTVCGEANARNGFGGYVGFEPFAIVVKEDNSASTYAPLKLDPQFRPIMRRAVAEMGC
ncbi:hypothetical protein [Methylobacterium bullatum]|uniref:Uncharacterized protein n=1 Tax=Methylobacterium bullatum TaxID=570505 RepID=A0A679K0E3_9HYPH|nr:hypothetical protein MBLL_03363 [Methylobacterium bullatum]